ncbi:MAG TPA: hypothetical protein VJ453_00880 [Terriglobales bacterium]|nr:hypothetical protein [Terriglobales bacterium]
MGIVELTIIAWRFHHEDPQPRNIESEREQSRDHRVLGAAEFRRLLEVAVVKITSGMFFR